MNNTTTVDFYGTAITVSVSHVTEYDDSRRDVWFDVVIGDQLFIAAAQLGEDGEWTAIDPAIDTHRALRDALDEIGDAASPVATSVPMPGYWGGFANSLCEIAANHAPTD